jgi:hypothetical protein
MFLHEMQEQTEGNPPKMAPITSTDASPTTARAQRPIALMALAAGITLALGACSAPRFATVSDIPVEPDLGAATGYSSTYTAVAPRAFISDDDLAADAPDRYTVIEGDTLWDISDRFLKQPWLWTTIWNYNPEIANPHLIYPGDVLALEYVDNRPTLVLSRNGEVLPMPRLGAANGPVGPNGEPLLGAATPGVERLSPRIREESLEQAIPVIEAASISSFLVHPRIASTSVIRSAPYVVANNEGRLISAAGHEIYARGDIDPSVTEYGIYRPSGKFTDPATGEHLGNEVTHVANAKLLAVGDPSTLMIVENHIETTEGDILLPRNAQADVDFTPRMPEIRGDGRIVALIDAMVQSGRNQVVVLNLGERSGVQPGDLLAIESRGNTFIDKRGSRSHQRVKMPNTRTGVVMVFQSFEKVSYALVMESTRPIREKDFITGI